MQLALIIALLATFVIADNSPGGPVAGVGMRCLGVAAGMLVAPLAAMCGSLVIARGLSRETATARRWFKISARFKQALLLLWLVAGLGSVYLCNWSGIVRQNWGLGGVFLIDKLLILLPVLAPLVLCWAALYEVERAGEVWLAAAGGFAPPPARRGSYLSLQTRHYFGLCVLPVLVVAAVQDGLALYFPWAVRDWGAAVVYGVPLGLLLFAFPLVLRLIWKTTRLPNGPLRERLEATAKRAGLSLSDIFVWHTDGHVLNAAVAGFLPRMRYVYLTDALMARLPDDEVTAAFAHEVGHVRYRHLLLRLAVLAAPLLPLLVFAGPASGEPDSAALPGSLEAWIGALVLPLFMLAYVGLALGWYSRLLEYEADLWASGLGFDSPRDEAAVAHFTTALARLAAATGSDPRKASWLHPSIQGRIEFLYRTADDPRIAAVFQRRLRWIFACWMLATAAGCAAAWAIS